MMFTEKVIFTHLIISHFNIVHRGGGLLLDILFLLKIKQMYYYLNYYDTCKTINNIHKTTRKSYYLRFFCVIEVITNKQTKNL